MRKSIILTFLALALSAAPIFAQEEATEAATPTPEAITEAPAEYLYPGLLPDHPLYFLKSFVYTIRGVFVFGDEAKARWFLKLADKRAAEARELAKKGKVELATRVSEKAVATRDKAIEHLEVAKAVGKDVSDLIEKLEGVSIRQQAVLDRVLEKVPEQAKEAIRQAKEKSVRGHERAIEALKAREERAEEEEKKVEEEIEEEEATPSGKDCQTLWWFDDQTRSCQKKRFCGMYMYEGLRTFEIKKECEAELD